MGREVQRKIAKAMEERVERLAVFFEHKGFTRMMGKVFAYLLLEDPPHQDFFSIQEYLQASKSSVSVSLNGLMDKGFIKYITFRGDRKRYFVVDPKGWREALIKDIRTVTDLNEVMEEILENRKGTMGQF